MDELRHHGIKGQKWGVRRYQNEDGSLTALGKMRRTAKKAAKTYRKVNDSAPVRTAKAAADAAGYYNFVARRLSAMGYYAPTTYETAIAIEKSAGALVSYAVYKYGAASVAGAGAAGLAITGAAIYAGVQGAKKLKERKQNQVQR